MILCPPEWHEWRAGDVLMYVRRPGLASLNCVMTYQERVTPIRSFPTLFHAVLADDPEFELLTTNKITRFVTDEGEYGALIIAQGRFRKHRISHVIASVFGDEFCTLLDARVETEFLDAHAELVLQLARTDRLGLGARRRRYGFSPPRGWHPIAGMGLDVVLLPPEYPALHGAITIYPAEPLSGVDPHAWQNTHDQRVGIEAADEVCQLAASPAWKRGKGLTGEQWSTVRQLPNSPGKIVRHFVVLRDERYFYAAKLETMDGPHVKRLHDTFVETIGSIEPLPEPNTSRATASDVFSMWSE